MNINSINNIVSKVLDGSKTNLNTGLMGMLSLYLSTKGFDLAEIQVWAESVFVSVNSLIVLLTAAGVWFRQLGKK